MEERSEFNYLKDQNLIKKPQADIVVQEVLHPTQDIEKETSHQEEVIGMNVVVGMTTITDHLEGGLIKRLDLALP